MMPTASRPLGASMEFSTIERGPCVNGRAGSRLCSCSSYQAAVESLSIFIVRRWYDMIGSRRGRQWTSSSGFGDGAHERAATT